MTDLRDALGFFFLNLDSDSLQLKVRTEYIFKDISSNKTAPLSADLHCEDEMSRLSPKGRKRAVVFTLRPAASGKESNAQHRDSNLSIGW